MSRWTDLLRKHEACGDGIAWAKGFATMQKAWDACEQPEWMLWLLNKLGVDRKLMVLLACYCAATALPIWRKRYPKDDRPAECIRVTRAWAHSKATIEEVRQAQNVAYDATAAAYDAAYDSAYDSVYDAYAAYAAASAAAYAAYAAAAAAAADADAARLKANRRMAALIRKAVPKPARAAK